ncbi:MAG TPA: metalloregulator ArsR/SmtB family transcription factor [Candidatus Saccharimonadales bacterium]|nr:metalloregulator ArsR/SmtB family transcription factor [Candidatus Saccharimonadales bacterium]
MVEYTFPLDQVFASLADPTRRDIVSRLQWGMLNISAVAEPYDISLAAVSKHLKVLERARLVVKRKKGRECYVALSPEVLHAASEYLQQYEALWNQRLESVKAS